MVVLSNKAATRVAKGQRKESQLSPQGAPRARRPVYSIIVYYSTPYYIYYSIFDYYHIYIYIYIYMYIHIHTHLYIQGVCRACQRPPRRTPRPFDIHSIISLSLSLSLYIYIYTHQINICYIITYTYICMYIYIYIYMVCLLLVSHMCVLCVC